MKQRSERREERRRRVRRKREGKRKEKRRKRRFIHMLTWLHNINLLLMMSWELGGRKKRRRSI